MGKRWRLVASCVAIASAIGIALALLMKPVYRSEVVVALSVDDLGLDGLSGAISGLGAVASSAGIDLKSKSGPETESMGILRSKALLVELIEQKGLMPVLFADRVDPATGKWKAKAKVPTMGDALLMFERRIRQVREDLKTGLVIVRVDWTDRFAAAEWAAALVDLANNELRNRAVAEADSSLLLLKSEWEKSDAISLRDALSRLIETQLRSRTLASVRQDYAFKVVDAARVADLDKRVKPARTVMVIASGAAGFLLAAIIVLLQRGIAAQRSAGSNKRVGNRTVAD